MDKCKRRGMLHYFYFYLVFCNLGTITIFLFWELEDKDTRCIYVTYTARSNSITFFSYSFAGLACCIKAPISAPISPGVQANENTAAKNVRKDKL